MTMLPRFVLPAVATLGVMYPATFLFGLWKSAENGDVDAPGSLVNDGELAAGWRYEVYHRNFPKTFRLDMSAVEHGFGTLCVLEVRGNGPKPISATRGPGTLVFVRLDKPLPGQESNRITIDMREAERARCAGVVTEGQLYAGGAVSTRMAERAKTERQKPTLDARAGSLGL